MMQDLRAAAAAAAKKGVIQTLDGKMTLMVRERLADDKL